MSKVQFEADKMKYKIYWYTRGKPDVYLAKPASKRANEFHSIPITSHGSEAASFDVPGLLAALELLRVRGMLPKFGNASLCIGYYLHDRRVA